MGEARNAALALLLSALVALSSARAQGVRIVTGATPIPGGAARSPGDITVINDKLAFALAVHSSVPYGVPRGALVDLAPVRHGELGRNRVVFADFIPNNWSAWPNTYSRIEILEHGPQRVRIRTVRDWGEVTITTLYTLAAGADELQISATMTNRGNKPLPNLLSGLTLWPNSGFIFPVPGIVPVPRLAGIESGKADAALARRVVAYDADWTVTLHAPYFDHVGSNSRYLLRLHTLAPLASRTFRGWLQVGTSGDLAPVVGAEIARDHLRYGTLSGAISGADGQPLEQPVLVVEKDGKPYAWTLGHAGGYALRLPAGDYTLFATARGCSRSRIVALRLPAGGQSVQYFRDLQGPGRIELEVAESARGTPLDARITLTEGEAPPVEFLGRRTFFTELERPGHAAIPLAPGNYRLRVSSGGGFLAADTLIQVTVAAHRSAHVTAKIARLFAPAADGWYAADLHHHADQAEAVTPPADLARSQLAAGLDLLFVSDHDSTVNHAALREIAARRGVPFIPGIELSPSWGHFNAYPLDPGAQLAIDPSTAGVDAIFAEARREGAAVIQVNHPYITYGYFTSLEAGVAPGGFNPGFDLIEINSAEADDDARVLAKLWTLWNEGKHYYLAAGSDTHDVWSRESGRVRTFAHVDGPITPQSFVSALRHGCAYVSYGPLLLSPPPCSPIRASAGRAPVLEFAMGAVAGLSKAQLIGAGEVLETRTFSPGQTRARVRFEPARDAKLPSWYALVIEDQQGRKAYTDPYWVLAAP
jgi:hypothetical protein